MNRRWKMLVGRWVFFRWGVVKLPTRTLVLRKLDEVERLLPSLAAEFPMEREHLTMLRHLRDQVTYRPDHKKGLA
jgi:hypothetical protein